MIAARPIDWPARQECYRFLRPIGEGVGRNWFNFLWIRTREYHDDLGLDWEMRSAPRPDGRSFAAPIDVSIGEMRRVVV